MTCSGFDNFLFEGHHISIIYSGILSLVGSLSENRRDLFPHY